MKIFYQKVNTDKDFRDRIEGYIHKAAKPLRLSAFDVKAALRLILTSFWRGQVKFFKFMFSKKLFRAVKSRFGGSQLAWAGL